jgi:response regulator RpfG family c-di-GMP phosphodiesterase
MTAFGEEYSPGVAISAGAREFIKKPFSLDEFGIRLNKMINDSETLRRRESEENGDEDIHDSETLRRRESEENGDGDIHDLMDELEETLKKN